MSQVDARPTTKRMEAERAQRRRRDDLGVGRGRNLDVSGTKDTNYEYRWVNDDPGRMHNLTVRDDWEVVNSGDLGEVNAKDKGVGTPIERIVDKRNGKRAVLLRKPKDYYLGDKAKEQGQIDETEKAIKRGAVPMTGAGAGEQMEAGKAYIPSGGISIQANGSKPYAP